MQLPQPYLYESERTFALVDRQYIQPFEGLIADTVFGYHTLWAAEVPFIPARTGTDDKDFDSEATNRLNRVMQRQVRLLYDLAQMRDHLTTFELRLVSRPQAHGLARVGIAFLGKVFHRDKQLSAQLALNLWDKFSAIFPHEAPFSYPLVPVRHYEENKKSATASFREWFEPIPFGQLTSSRNIVELRKYEDWPRVYDVGGTLHARDYIPHSFVPALDYSALARLFETLAHQQQLCMVAITLRPQRLTDAEVAILHELAGWYARGERGEVGINNPLVDVLREQLQSDLFESYTRARGERGKKVYDELVREHLSLFTVRLQVAGGAYFAPDDLIEALGSEVMANAGSAYPSRWVRVEPREDEMRWALHNLQWLEFARWGISPLVQRDQRIIRLRSLATVTEAAGAFRLPVAPASGGLAGLDVHDEPFTLPHAPPAPGPSAIEIGTLLDRGIPLDATWAIPVSTFSGVIQIFGDDSAARSQVLKQMLAGISGAGIPWVLISSSDKSALAGTLDAHYVKIDEVAKQHELGIQPLLPPPGVPLARFVDALLRVFQTVFGLDNPAATLLRQALLETYQAARWTDQEAGRIIPLTDIVERIESVAQQLYVPSEIAAALLTRCALPLRDMATTAARTLATPYASTFLLERPLVIEIGWVGSDLSQSLLCACLWLWYTLALTAGPVSSIGLKGLVGLEPAHVLSGVQATGMASLASGCVGALLLDDRPDLLETDITSRATMTILTSTGNITTLEKTAAIVGASPRQQERMIRLGVAEAVIALRGEAPVLVSLPGCL